MDAAFLVRYKMKKLLKTLSLLTILLFLCFSCNNTATNTNINTGDEPGSGGEEIVLPTEPGTNAVSSLKKIGDGVYSLEYFGDYLLDALVEADVKDENALREYLEGNIVNWKTYAEISSTLKITTPEGFACSSLAAVNTDSVGGMIYGRNFDWFHDTGILTLHTKPTKGYESISTVSLEFLKLERNWVPTDADKQVTLLSVFAPLDGMNEKGLYVSVLVADDKRATAQATEKHDVTTTVAVRYLLDNADSVDKALELLQSVDMQSALGMSYHFALADNIGKSVVVEWFDGEMYVTDTRVVTNHYISSVCLEKSGNTIDENTGGRYNTLIQTGSNKNWEMSQTEVRDAMDSVKQHERTVWTVVYEGGKRKGTYYFREDYTKPVTVEF